MLETGFLGKGSGKLMDQALKQLLTDLRPQMVPLVEVSDKFTDFTLSSIGNKYGDIYETQFECASSKKNPLNKELVPSFYQTYQSEVMKMRPAPKL